MIEEWRPVVGYEGLYEVSNHGNVRSCDRVDCDGRHRRGTTMKQHEACGYMRVGLRKNGVQRKYLVHRLVAQAFVSGYRDGMEVNHIDENPLNNLVTNLEWVTSTENKNHGTRTERVSEKLKETSKDCKPVVMMLESGEEIQEFVSLTEAGKQLGIHRSAIARAIKRGGTASGYRWKYKE